MTITLTHVQLAWLEAHVARGEFATVEDAVRRLIDERMAEADDSLVWAKADVDEAVAGVARGEVIGRAEFQARNAARLAAISGE